MHRVNTFNAVSLCVFAEFENPAFFKKSAHYFRVNFLEAHNAVMVKAGNNDSILKSEFNYHIVDGFFNTGVLINACFKLNICNESVNRFDEFKIFTQGGNSVYSVNAPEAGRSVKRLKLGKSVVSDKAC